MKKGSKSKPRRNSHPLVDDYCCGFSWKAGCKLYAVFDIIICLIAFAFYGQVLEIFFDPEEDDGTTLHLDLKDLSNNKIDPVYLEAYRVIHERIIKGCGDISTDPKVIHDAFVKTVGLFSIASVGYFFTAIALIVGLGNDVQERRNFLIILLVMELIFLLFTILGAIFSQKEALCPIDYNLYHIPRQKLLLFFAVFQMIYKVHEIYTISRFILQGQIEAEVGIEGQDQEVTLTLSDQALRSRRKSYAMMGMTPNQSMAGLKSEAPSPSSSEMETILHPPNLRDDGDYESFRRKSEAGTSGLRKSKIVHERKSIALSNAKSTINTVGSSRRMNRASEVSQVTLDDQEKGDKKRKSKRKTVGGGRRKKYDK